MPYPYFKDEESEKQRGQIVVLKVAESADGDSDPTSSAFSFQCTCLGKQIICIYFHVCGLFLAYSSYFLLSDIL